MRRRRVLVLMHDDLMPPADATSVPEDHYVPWKTEFDVTSGLRDQGHDVQVMGANTDLTPIREAIAEFRPHVAFNLLESFHDVPAYDSYVTSYLELLRQPYTGCNPRGLMLTRDKALSRKIMAYHRIPGPGFAVFLRGRAVRKPTRVSYPLLVKALDMDGSVGLAQASIVRDDAKLEERVRFLQETYDTDVIAEEYVAGREIYVPILGNRRLQVLPVMELNFGKLAEDAEPIATSRLKWDWKYQEKRGIELEVAKLKPEVAKRVERVAKRVYRALNLSGYARIDFRLTEEGIPFVIEANPNADVGFGEEFHEAGEVAGLAYGDLLDRILRLGENYQAGWRTRE